MSGITCCKGCEERTREPVDCHMICERYLEQRKAYEEDKQKKRAYKLENGYEADCYFKQTCGKKRFEREKKK